MYRKGPQGWLKHLDFTVLNLVALHASYCMAYFIRMGTENPYHSKLYRTIAVLLTLFQLLVTIVCHIYKGVLKRGHFREAISSVKQSVLVVLLAVFVLFMMKMGAAYSRKVMALFGMIYLAIGYVVTHLWKEYIRRHRVAKKSIVIVAVKEYLNALLAEMDTEYYNLYRVAGVVLLDATEDEAENYNTEYADLELSIYTYSDEVLEQIMHGWVDEVYVNIPFEKHIPENLLGQFADMGITVHVRVRVPAELSDYQYVFDKQLGHHVLTVSTTYITTYQAFVKRAIDILGGIVGCIFTGILTIILAPCIYIASPGPIFFSQYRIGKNGKKFKIYKFRSMYMDAEARKAELMEQNQVKDGMMFKMEYDPRIIGCKKLPDGTIKKGIGNRIRDWSLDEFPQFFNVLKGDMSLIGTRPPTEDEWEKYSAHHRGRMAIKPGITGLWQVSGRSNITDFDEVVRLDRKYIDEWSLVNDIKILFKTVGVVLKGEGSM